MREEALLSKIGEALPILSDLCRADLLLFRRTGRDEAVVVAQARPHSFTPLWEEDCVGMTVTAEERPAVLAGLNGHIRHKTMHTTTVHGTTAAREVYPARGTSGETIAVLAKDSFWLAYERHRRRSKVFQQVLDQLISMVLRGELEGAKDLSPFGENDGILYVSNDRRIQYMSGIASAMYRQLGYRDSLVGRRLGDIESVDQDLVVKAWADVRCIERQDEHASLTWTRKAIPLISEDGGWWPLRRRTAPSKP
ncbi:MAG: histidine kinase N-terminal domain-containing protein, partial [Chloroflexi bacterium]|nr:histidine kinase N-terminal domain-containing protein [Chloroflexota bacterium]